MCIYIYHKKMYMKHGYNSISFLTKTMTWSVGSSLVYTKKKFLRMFDLDDD